MQNAYIELAYFIFHVRLLCKYIDVRSNVTSNANKCRISCKTLIELEVLQIMLLGCAGIHKACTITKSYQGHI